MTLRYDLQRYLKYADIPAPIADALRQLLDESYPDSGLDVSESTAVELLSGGGLIRLSDSDGSLWLEVRTGSRSCAVEVAHHTATQLAKQLVALSQPPDDDGMCPNCVTPWKCNGPHG